MSCLKSPNFIIFKIDSQKNFKILANRPLKTSSDNKLQKRTSQWKKNEKTEFVHTIFQNLDITLLTCNSANIFANFRFHETFIRGAINQTNIVFGGYDINIDRIVFTHGTVDPWYPLGLYQPSDKKNYDTIFIKGKLFSLWSPSRKPRHNIFIVLEQVPHIVQISTSQLIKIAWNWKMLDVLWGI